MFIFHYLLNPKKRFFQKVNNYTYFDKMYIFRLNLKNILFKIKNPIFQVNFGRYDKTSKCKIICFEEVYKCSFIHFFPLNCGSQFLLFDCKYRAQRANVREEQKTTREARRPNHVP